MFSYLSVLTYVLGAQLSSNNMFWFWNKKIIFLVHLTKGLNFSIKRENKLTFGYMVKAYFNQYAQVICTLEGSVLCSYEMP